MRTLSLFLVVIVALTIVSPSYGDVTLYDSSVSGQTPDDQNLYYLALFPPVAATQVWEAPGLTRLNTTGDITESAGYYNYDTFLSQAPKTPLTLDRTGDGYTLRFFAQVVSENHGNNNRAGFSVIALSGDDQGIELGFWAGSIWAQDDTPTAFIHDESALFDTTVKVVKYDLAIKGTGYTLYGDDVPLLSGLLRDYDANVPIDVAHHVYHQANFVFLGDNTSSASAELLLGDVAVLDAAVPEPATAAVLLVGFAAALARRKRSAA